MVRVFYSPQYVVSEYSFDTTRKAKWIADSLSESPIPGIELVEPEPLTGIHVAGTHDPHYVRAVETGLPHGLAESQGFRWDAQMWPMVLASNGGAFAAAHRALECGVSGSISSGLHHARYNRGAAFCTFNGLVIAAKAALKVGARAVLILDLDAHCGGGTASLIADEARIWQIDVAVSGFDSYPSTDRAWQVLVESYSDYLPTVKLMLKKAEQLGPAFDLCLYNAGMDPLENCPTGGLAGITRQILAEREELVYEWCAARRLPIAFVLAGGYVGPDLEEQELVSLHRLTLSAASQFHLRSK